jgi:tetratricopeptide (TPR) repeat protein
MSCPTTELLRRAEADLRAGRPREAQACLANALPAIERAGDRRHLRTALNLRGVAQLELGALNEAERSFASLLELARNDGDELLTARAFNNLGALADMRDRFDEAISFYERAIPTYQRLGQRRGLAESHHNLAISLRRRGQLAKAQDHERQAISYATEADNAMLESLARLGLAEVALVTHDSVLAEAIARHAAKRFGALGDSLREADALRVLGAACLAQQKLSVARDVVDRARQLATAHGARLLEAEIRLLDAELLLASGNEKGASREAGEAARLFDGVGSPGKAKKARDWHRHGPFTPSL